MFKILPLNYVEKILENQKKDFIKKSNNFTRKG